MFQRKNPGEPGNENMDPAQYFYAPAFKIVGKYKPSCPDMKQL